MYRKNFKSFIVVLFKFHLTLATVSDRDYALMPDLFQIDDYDKCMLYGNETLYCTVKFQLYPENPDNTSRIWQIIEEISTRPSNYRHDWLRYGICVPETCPNIDRNQIRQGLEECYNQKFLNHGLFVEVLTIHCQTQQTPYSIDIYDIFVLSVFSIYCAFVIVASFIEGLARYKSAHNYERTIGTWYGKIMACFSIPKNWQRLTTINLQNADIRALRCIQGVRFYNMICVILSHTVMISLAMPIKNPIYTETITHNTLNMFVANGGYAVQTFFLISGWLLTYHLYEAFDNKQSLTFSKLFLVFINRYLRLTPALIVVIAFHCTWLVHTGRGPFWDHIVGVEYRRCRQNWWTNLLYINNYVNKEEMCLQQTWYLAVDTHLFIFSLIIIKLMIEYPKFVKIILGSAITVALLVPFLISFINDLDIVVRQYPEPLYNILLNVPDWHLMYTSTVNNINGYLIGITFGYIFYKTRENKKTVSKWFVVFWWFFTYGGAISIILIAARMYTDDFNPTRLESALYWAFGRNIFALCLAVGIYGLTIKVGWLTRWACQWPPVQILGRLTFTAYLVHVSLLKTSRGMQRSPIYLSNYQLLYNLLGDVFITYLVATILCLFVEMPLSALQKMLLVPDKHKKSGTDGEIKINA